MIQGNQGKVGRGENSGGKGPGLNQNLQLKQNLNIVEFRYNMLEFRVSGGGFLRAAQVATMLWA